MPHIQISFLGAPQRKGGVFAPRGDYQRACYRFPDQALAEESLFALALAKHHQPDVVLLLGTPGSAWHSLIDWLGYPDEALPQADALYSRLEALSQLQSTTATEVEALEAFFRPVLPVPWRLRLIPVCQTAPEFHALLELIAQEVSPGDRVTFDVTHGLRHLPMLALLAGLYLQQVRRVAVKEILYGALELSQEDAAAGRKTAPVLSLSGVLEVARWLDAISRFQASGDYAQFGKLLPTNGALFRRASFLERTGQSERLRKELPKLEAALSQDAGPIHALFEPALREAFVPARQQDSVAFLRAMAEQALDRGDFRDTAIYAEEAFIEWLAGHQQPPPAKPEERSQLLDGFIRAKGTHRYAIPDERLSPMQDYARQLRHFRNAWAHGDTVLFLPKQFKDSYGNVLENAQTLTTFFATALDLLIPKSRAAENIATGAAKQVLPNPTNLSE